VPLHDGLHRSESAEAAASHLRKHTQVRHDRKSELQARARADRKLLEELTLFLTTYPDPNSLTTAETTLAAADSTAAAKSLEVGELKRTQTQSEGQARQARQLHDRAVDEANRLANAQSQLQALTRTDDRVQEYRETVRTAQEGLDNLAGRIEGLETELDRLAGEREETERLKERRQREAAQATQEAEAVRIMAPESPPPPDDVERVQQVGLTMARASYQALMHQWTTSSSASVLEARLEQTESNVQQVREKVSRQLDGHDDPVPLAALAQERARTHSSQQCEVEALALRAVLDSKIGKAADAATAHKQAGEALTTARSNRDRSARVTRPVEFTTVEAAHSRVRFPRSSGQGVKQRWLCLSGPARSGWG